MNQYVGKTCPYCKCKFDEADEIVVCSACDMPHHKECWVENQGCTTFGCTGTIQSIDQMGVSDNGGTSDAGFEIDFLSSDADLASAYCPRCGSSHDPADLTCKHCGQSLSTQRGNVRPGNGSVSTDRVPPEPMITQAQRRVENGYDDDMRSLIGPNYEYYERKRSEMRDACRITSWNWSAFLFAPYWCVYRKMYGIGIALLCGAVILSFLNSLWSIVSLVGLVVFGIYANDLYLQQIDRKATAAQEMDEHTRSAYIRKKGGTSTLAVVLVLIGYVVITAIVSIGYATIITLIVNS